MNALRRNSGDGERADGGTEAMGSILESLFARRSAESEDEVLGCDMVPPPSALAALFDPQAEDDPARPASPAPFGPFTTMAQAPIRDG